MPAPPMLLLLILLSLGNSCSGVLDESYTLVIKTGRTGTSNRVYIMLQGLSGDSPQQLINYDSSNNLIPDMFTPGKVDVISGKFRGALGYIQALKVSLDSYSSGWEIVSIVIHSAATFVSNNDTFVCDTPQDIKFNTDGGWGAWSDWFTCRGDCVTGGKQSRLRSCNSPPQINQGKPCSGARSEEQACALSIICPVKGNWSGWSQWGACSVTCAQGSRVRGRTCTNPAPANGGSDCSGPASETGVCSATACPINGQWGSWSAYGACNATCGQGVKIRSRECDSPAPQFGGSQCSGSSMSAASCQLIQCPIDGGWSDWGEFSSCSASCGPGSQRRTRPCSNPPPQFNGLACPGSGSESRDCNLRPCPIDGQWSQWSSYSVCSRTCGAGSQWRGRNCSSPQPQFDGLDCVGAKTESRGCNDKSCPINGGWSEWSDFSDCSAACGNGSQTRWRNCSSPWPQFGGLDCPDASSETQVCHKRHCPIDGGWSSWSEFTACSLTCGTGRQFSSRSCTQPRPQYDGKNCSGDWVRDSSCLVTACPVDGLWGQWSEWAACSVTCANGTTWRSRQCDSPAPQFHGRDCQGVGNESQPCHPVDCPINGGWSQWSDFTSCSAICGGGRQNRSRVCNNPEPYAGGANCVGSGSHSQDCNQQPCPVNGGWSSWTSWGSCTRSCGSGQMQRSRGCTNPVPMHDGADCPGSGLESTTCDIAPCPVDGAWGSWSDWGACSADCGPGLAYRKRACDNPAPRGGAQCVGSESSQQACMIKACPVDGGWSGWSNWGACDKTCGGGTRSRARSCDSPKPQNGGRACGGQASHAESCSEDNCPIDGDWSAWSQWSPCSTSCERGQAGRQRDCSNPKPNYGGRACSGSGSDIRDCNYGPCPVHGGWSEWTSYSNCSGTCGSGTQSRSRSCDKPAPAFGGRYCLPCTANMTLPELEDNATTTSVKDYVSVEDGCSYNGNYYVIEGGNVVWDDDTQFTNCSLPPCITALNEQANNLIDEFLNMNANKTSQSDKESMKAAEAMVNKIANLLADQLKNAEIGKPVMINAKGLTVGVSKANSSNLGGSQMASGNMGGVVLGEAKNTGMEGKDVNLKFSALDSKTFFPGGDKKDQSAAVLTFNLASGTEVVKPDNNSKVSLTLALPNQNAETVDSLLKPVGMSRTQRMVQKIVLDSKNTAVKISMELPSSDNYVLMFRAGSPANRTSQANVTARVHPDGSIQTESDGTLSVRVTRDAALAKHRHRRRREVATPVAIATSGVTLSVFIPGGQLQAGSAIFMSLEVANNGTGDNATASAGPTSASSNDSISNLTLTVGVASITPRQFVDSEWVDSDADVAEESSIEKMVFKSNFFGSYSGKMFISPNTINFANVFNNFAGKLAENFVTLLVLCIIIGIYVVVSLWMWRLDRQDARNLRFEPLTDNEFDNDYTFIISVYTGDESGADTTSNVFINLAGTWGSSGKRQLSDEERVNFTRGSVCNFAMTTRAPLGELRGLKVWHDNSGKRPGWFLEKILIEDLQTKKNYIFMCDQWLAEKKFDSRTMRVLPEIKQDERFQEMLLRYKAGGVVNKHVITTLFRKTGQSSYTRLQRTGVANAMFFLTMVCNAMWFGKGDDLDAEANFSIDLGPISVTWFQLYSGILSMAITYPCIFTAAEIFRRTKKWRRRWSEDDMENQKKEIRLPKGFLVIGWGLLLLGVGLSFFFTFMYSMEWGKEKANGWLKSFFLGVLQLIVVTDPVMLLIVFVLAKKFFGQKEAEENVFELDDLINDELKQVLDGTEYNPPDPSRLEEIRAERRNSQKMSQTFTDIMSYVVYMFLLIALAYDTRDQVSYRQNQNLKDQFLNAAPTTFANFGEVFNWLNTSVVPKLYRNTDYNNQLLVGDLAKAIDTCDCIRQGPFRLRQLRVNPRKCPVTWPFGAYLKQHWTCSSDYSSDAADKATYRPLWLPDSHGWIQNRSQQLRAKSQIKRLRPDEIALEAFWYRNTDYLMSFPFEGVFAIYPGDGYAATMGLNSKESMWIINRLRATNWLDERTRAMFVEGTVYNANTNLFTTIQLLVEFPAAGGILTYRNGIRTYRLYNYTGGKGIVLMAMQGLFALICLYQIYKEMRSLLILRLKYFDDLWNKIEFVNILLCIAIMLSYGIRIKITIDAVTLMMNNRGMYVAFDNVIQWVEFTCIAMAFSVFLTIFRVLKFLGFNRHIAILLATVKQCALQLSSFGVAFVLIMVAFLSSGTILFSLTESSFASVLSSCRSLFTTAIGIQGYRQIFLNTQGKASSLVFFAGWSCLSVFFLVSVFVSILTDTYGLVVSEGLYTYDEEFVNHMWTKFMGVMSSVSAKKDELSEALNKGVNVVKKKMVTADDIEIQLNEDRLRQLPAKSTPQLKELNPGLAHKLAVVNLDKPETGESYRWTPKQTGDEVLVDAGQLSEPTTNDHEHQEDWIPRFKSNALDASLGGGGRGLGDSGASAMQFDPLANSADSTIRLMPPPGGLPPLVLQPVNPAEEKKTKKKKKQKSKKAENSATNGAANDEGSQQQQQQQQQQQVDSEI